MSEVLLRVVDKPGLERERPAGYVVHVAPNGWAWTPAELTNPDWQIVRVNPNLVDSEVEALRTPKNQAGLVTRLTRAFVAQLEKRGPSGQGASMVNVARAVFLAGIITEPE
jgi:hypothetical protein